MGTTLDAFNAGSTKFVYVATIQSYPYLLTSGSTSAAVAAWSGSDWTQALGGLFVEFKQDQALDPDDPFSNLGGTCTLHVSPDASDTFGIDSARRGGGAETYLEESIDRNDATVTVKSTSAFPSSGTIYIGTEAIAYTGKTATTFTGCSRGMHAGLTCDSGRFSHDHRVDFDANGVKLQPLVSERPRQWLGRWVEVWTHRVVDGVLDAKAQAHKLFSGRLAEMRDDPNTGCRVLSLQHVLGSLGEAVVGSGAWEGTAASTEEGGSAGVYLKAGDKFVFADLVSAAAETANELLVVTSGASGANQVSAGHYGLGDLCAKITAWLTAEKAAGRLNGTYSIASPAPAPEGPRTKVYWTLNGATTVSWRFGMPKTVAAYFGFQDAEGGAQNLSYVQQINVAPSGGSSEHYYQPYPPLQLSVVLDGSSNARFRVVTKSGSLANQYSQLPSGIRPPSSSIGGTSYNWGIFLVGDGQMIVAAWATPFGDELLYASPAFNDASSVVTSLLPGFVTPVLQVPDGGALIVRQVYAFEGAFKSILPGLLLSTGTQGYNEIGYDQYPTGAGLPLSLLASTYEDDIAELQGADTQMLVIIDRPTELTELLSSDFVMRWVFPVWRNGGLTFDSWKIPSADKSIATLAESNKAEPSQHAANQKSATQETDKWQRSIVKIRYNRDAADPKSDEYRSTVILEDRVAVDDAGGGGKVKTINLRNTYKEFGGTGQSVEALIPMHMTLMPLISRPANIVRRSIDLRYFLSLSIGEVVLFTDAFARDPETGARGVSLRPALIARHSFTPGGLTPTGGTQPMTGEVELFFTDLNTDRIAATYVPSGDVDDTHSSGGFSAGYSSATNTLRLYAHRYSESSEAVDASHFAAGYKILIIERDPLDATAPVSWEREVGSVSGSDIVLTSALSSPAWDATKKYRVLFQPYDTAATAQRVKAYQADDEDGLIIDITQPYLYGSATADSSYTAESTPEIELVPDMVMVDGAARDVGHEAALIRQVDNFLDYKSCIQQPLMFNAIVSNLINTTGYRLVAYWPIFLSYEIPSNAIYRLLTVAPMARSSDGTSTKIKIGLWRDPPDATSLNNLARTEGVSGEVEWTGITSTDMAVLATQTLTINIKHPFTGQAWLVLELGYKCQTYGISQMVEGARVAV